jgi:CBS domain-containing protein
MGSDNERRVEEIMTPSLTTISGEAPLSEAARLMRDEAISSVLVPGARTGIITSTDVIKAVADGLDPETAIVEESMTAPVESITVELRVEEVAAMMTTYGINHLPVRDTDGDYVGIVSSTDLRETIAET